MIKITDSKTIKGRILKVGHLHRYCSNWGEILFSGKEVIVCVKNKRKRQKIPMYIRDDSLLGIMQLTSKVLVNRNWEITLHGESLINGRGSIFIKRILPISQIPKQININDYFTN